MREWTEEHIRQLVRRKYKEMGGLPGEGSGEVNDNPYGIGVLTERELTNIEWACTIIKFTGTGSLFGSGTWLNDGTNIQCINLNPPIWRLKWQNASGGAVPAGTLLGYFIKQKYLISPNRPMIKPPETWAEYCPVYRYYNSSEPNGDRVMRMTTEVVPISGGGWTENLEVFALYTGSDMPSGTAQSHDGVIYSTGLRPTNVEWNVYGDIIH